MFYIIAVWALACFFAVVAALPAIPNNIPRACTNDLQNPSFETGNLDPWLPIVQSAWSADRGVYPRLSPDNRGKYYYYAHAVSTVESSLTMSQSGIMLPVGSTVDCHTWVAGSRSENVTTVTVFLDGVTCGTLELKPGDDDWHRVGSKVKVVGGVPGAGSTMAVVAMSKGAGDDGWDIYIDDMGVIKC
ncbi:hypothetical protein E8E12_011159 [Didymella heteroderae]|uniref:Uncharacterized protein n=1 Tax=Didymella heteroderae TaxID=1769908 RepID=A0A9P4X124_9PLEO|nr:hypothetical protein E8E12_011159 [Didymella heteroderae]